MSEEGLSFPVAVKEAEGTSALFPSRSRRPSHDVFLPPPSFSDVPIALSPAGQLPTLYDFHFEGRTKRWVPWSSLVPQYHHSPEVRFIDILGKGELNSAPLG